MNVRTVLLTLVVTLFSGTLLAGGGHHHGYGHSHGPVTRIDAEHRAVKMLTRFVNQEKLELSWLDAQVIKTERRIFNGRPEWVTSFTNKKIEDPEQRTLYIFMTLTGEYVATNYTGE